MAEKKASPLLPQKHEWKTLKPDPAKRDKSVVQKGVFGKDDPPYDRGYVDAMADNIDKSDKRDELLGHPVSKAILSLSGKDSPVAEEYMRGRAAARTDLGYRYAKGGSVREIGRAHV